MLYVALFKLMSGAFENMLSGQGGIDIHNGKSILKLISEAVCPARLIKAGTRKKP